VSAVAWGISGTVPAAYVAQLLSALLPVSDDSILQVMPIESSVMPGSGIQLTGKLGEVIRESVQIALSFIKTHAHTLQLTKSATEDLLEKRQVHVHMPEGSIGKEGPSAGIAILSSLVSLFTGHGLPSDLAMTGEMTLAGQVLRKLTFLPSFNGS